MVANTGMRSVKKFVFDASSSLSASKYNKVPIAVQMTANVRITDHVTAEYEKLTGSVNIEIMFNNTVPMNVLTIKIRRGLLFSRSFLPMTE